VMPALFPFELVVPERLLFSGDVEAVILSSIEGEMTVLANHAPVMAVLKPALVTIDDGKGHATRLYVRGGFADVRPDGLTVLAESAVPLDELDADLISRKCAASSSTGWPPSRKLELPRCREVRRRIAWLALPA
jgi:F-type H+-transporting ATPase subunit epsilon